MNDQTRPVVIVMADDDPDDVMLTREALEESPLLNDFRSVGDGLELLDYLQHEGGFADVPAPRPHLILLDLNMPRMSGLEALAKIKNNPSLKLIPVVVLTTSNTEEDIVRSYDLGAVSFVQKPVTYEEMVQAATALSTYWFEIVKLPKR